MTLEEAIANVENSIKELKDFLVQEGILVANPDDENGALVQNQNPEAIAAFNARRFLDIRL
ncbi:hypothetical protein [Methanosarcina sp. UBA5]|uniref:hypothetical protein n=1 Tax=Methanosarcina sp. UBA5 TaxID=1915593 RepID=UPI0025E86A32|nr:hypothetical protein [Methanosarcina sp. UBA5]